MEPQVLDIPKSETGNKGNQEPDKEKSQTGGERQEKERAKPEGAGSYPSRAVQSYTFTQGRPPGLNHRVGMLNCCHGARMLGPGPS